MIDWLIGQIDMIHGWTKGRSAVWVRHESLREGYRRSKGTNMSLRNRDPCNY